MKPASGLSPFVEMALEAPQRIALLTGAGASRPLGLPVMNELVDDSWRSTLGVEEHKVLYDMAANWASKDGVVDFEMLYTAVDAFVAMSRTDLASVPFAPHRGSAGFFFHRTPGSKIILDMEGAKKHAKGLREELKRRVHERIAEVDAEEAAQLYLPLIRELLGFQNGPMDLQVFTTNYDRSVESIWEAGLQREGTLSPDLVRGFRPENDLGFVFADESYDMPGGSTTARVFLHKLHGSLNWIVRGKQVLESPTDDYVRRNAVIYPLVKHDEMGYPFEALLNRFKYALDGQVSLLVVIGSALRDEHIRRIIREAMERNSRFKVVIHDPEAEAIKKSFSDQFDESLFPAPGYFGTEEGSRELRDRIMDAVTYGTM